MSKIFLLLAVFILACYKPAIKSEMAVTEASTETQRTFQMQTGQTLTETAMQADSVIVIRTDTLTVAKYYAVKKTETVRDTLTLVRVDTLARTDTVRIAAKTEEKPEPGVWGKAKNFIIWFIVGFLVYIVFLRCKK